MLRTYRSNQFAPHAIGMHLAPNVLDSPSPLLSKLQVPSKRDGPCHHESAQGPLAFRPFHLFRSISLLAYPSMFYAKAVSTSSAKRSRESHLQTLVDNEFNVFADSIRSILPSRLDGRTLNLSSAKASKILRAFFQLSLFSAFVSPFFLSCLEAFLQPLFSRRSPDVLVFRRQFFQDFHHILLSHGARRADDVSYKYANRR